MPLRLSLIAVIEDNEPQRTPSVTALALNFLTAGVLGDFFIVPLNALIQFDAGDAGYAGLGRILAGSNFVQNIVMPDVDETDDPGALSRSPARYLWATLIARLFEIFPLTCRDCGTEMTIIAFVIETPSVRAILESVITSWRSLFEPYFHPKLLRLTLALLLCLSLGAQGATYNDLVGDATDPDLIRLEYSMTGQFVDIKLTFADALVGSVIDPAVLASVLLDADRSNLTGFQKRPGFHTRFGIDYKIEVYLGGFGDTSNSATLKYWLRSESGISVVVQRERVLIQLGHPADPNGSIFVVGADASYGTTDYQAFVRIPFDLFANLSFPICGTGKSICIAALFPCPLKLTEDLGSAYVSVLAINPYSLNQGGDLLPDSGMLGGADSLLTDEYPTETQDLVAAVTDPDSDGYAQPGNNGEELIGLKAFRHPNDNVLSFELKLHSYSLEDTAIYSVALDLDGDSDTGEPLMNGSQVLGIDLFAEFRNFDNPIGETNPLEGIVTCVSTGNGVR